MLTYADVCGIAQNLAEVLYQQALAIEPTSPTALCSLGSLRYVC
jgi:hypothetical protein